MNYKGMDKDMKCRGFQYEVGGEYETDKAKACECGFHACECGFHACEYPLDVLNYYPPAGSRFFEVEQSGSLSKNDEDTKVASTKIKIGAELSIAGLVKAAVEYTKERCTQNEGDKATGYQGAASATGYQGAASATGDRGAASATGTKGAASATGDRGAASATGDRGAASATGYQGAASATGYQGAASATGTKGAASATGDRGAASATGKASAAMACGIEGKAMGSLGCALFLVERGECDGETYPIVAVKAAIVDGENVKPGVWYTLRNGELVEV